MTDLRQYLFAMWPGKEYSIIDDAIDQ